MRATARLLAAVRPAAARYLEPGTPTGLTGLLTHASPRSTLLYLYSTTLDRLAAGVPEHSVYRQSVEAVTRRRLALVEAAVPAGHAEWTARAQQLIGSHPDEFNITTQASVAGARAIKVERDGRAFVVHTDPVEMDMRDQEWDGEYDEGGELEGSRTAAEREDLVHIIERRDLSEVEQVEWEPEPQLTADQISELENKIGAGLIEEVIQVAEGELKLVDTMIQAKVWEPLEEKPAEGQWVYFERKA